MQDQAQRDTLLSQVKAIREKATAFSARFKDTQGPILVRQMVLNHLDDVEQLWLGENQPTMERWNAMYLQAAQMYFGWAVKNLASLEEQVGKYGGPENVQFIG